MDSDYLCVPVLKNINPVMLIGLWIFGLVPATLLGPVKG